MRSECELCDNAEEVASTSDGPEKVGVAFLASLDNAPISKDNFGTDNVVDCKTVATSEPSARTDLLACTGSQGVRYRGRRTREGVLRIWKWYENVPVTTSARQSTNAGVVDSTSDTCEAILTGGLINILPDTSTSSRDGHLSLINLHIAQFGKVDD
jgi:hypothetical protein